MCATAASGVGEDGRTWEKILKKSVYKIDKIETLLYNISRSHILNGQRIKKVYARADGDAVPSQASRKR